MSAPFLSLIIPAYNEAKRLPTTLEQVFAFLQKQDFSCEVIVVENGSTDDTFELAKSFSAQYPQMIVTRSEKGKGNAIRHGILNAHGTYRFICDADLSMPISDLLNFLPPRITDFDIAIASREATGAVRYNEPKYRHWGGRVINFFIRLLILPGLHDTQCGFKCFHEDVIPYLFERQKLTGWSFDIELLYIARRKKMRVREIPIQWYFYDDSKVNAVRDALHMITDIFRIHLNAWRGGYD